MSKSTKIFEILFPLDIKTSFWAGVFFLSLGIVSLVTYIVGHRDYSYYGNSTAMICWGLGNLLATSKVLPKWKIDEDFNPFGSRITLAIIFELIGAVIWVAYMFDYFRVS